VTGGGFIDEGCLPFSAKGGGKSGGKLATYLTGEQRGVKTGIRKPVLAGGRRRYICSHLGGMTASERHYISKSNAEAMSTETSMKLNQTAK
jgi:hypothetical protein